MCGRFSLFTPGNVLAERFDAAPVEPLEPRYNIAPREDVAVVTNDAPDEIRTLEWGLLPGWVDDPDDAPRPINARAETLDGTPTFRDAYRERRCLVLTDGFYDWQDRPDGKRPYRIAREDDAPFAMAGLWERRQSDGEVRETVAVITTEPNDTVRPIHGRMPAILAADEERRWLDDDADHGALLDPYPDDEFRAYPVSTAVNDPSNDGPDLIEPVEPDVQAGLDEFAS